MSIESLAECAHYVLCRVNPDETEETVSEHLTFEEGWQAGTRVVTVLDKCGAYSLYTHGRRVAKFGYSRLMSSRDATNVRFSLDLMDMSST